MAEKYLTKSFFITTPTGGRKQIKVRAKTKKELEKKFMEKKLAYESGKLTVNGNTLFANWITEWIETYKKPAVTDASLQNVKHIINKFFIPNLGDMKLCDIKTVHIQRCMNKLQNYSKSVINKAYIFINEAMEKAVANDIINKNPCNGVQRPKGKEKIRRRALTDEEIQFFLDTVKSHEKGLLFGIMFACGLRPSEARALTWKSINTKNKELTVYQTVEAGKNTTKDPKSKAGFRTVPIPDWYMELFNKKMIPNINKNEFIFFSKNGQPMPKSSIESAWKSFLRAMDIAASAETYQNRVIEHAIDQSLTPYYLRHTYATKLAENGVDMKTAQYLLGHSDITMTAQVYTHVTNKMLDSAREKINKTKSVQ